MNELLKKDIIIKIVSVLLGVLLWLYVMNVDNPYEPKRIPVPVKIINRDTLDENDLYLKNEGDVPTTVEVMVSGRREEVSNLSSSDFVVELDFSKVKTVDDKTLRINEPYLVTSKEVTIEGFYPQIVKLDLERIVTTSFPVVVTAQGNLKENYRLIEVTSSVDKVNIRDLESRVKSIAAIKGVVDVNGLDRSTERTIECKAYDAQGKEIRSLMSKITVVARVSVGKEVAVTPVIKGKPAVDHVETERSVSPEKVIVSGPSEVLAGLSELKTLPVDIENAKANMSVPIALELPDQVKLVGPIKEVTVNVAIEALEIKEFTIPREDIALRNAAIDNSLVYEVLTENVVVELKGRRVDLQNLAVNSLKPFIDVGGLEEGTHKVPLIITRPANTSLVQEREVEIKITKPESQE